MRKLSKSKVRALVRSLTAVATACGLGLTAEQVVAVQVALEAVLQVFYKDEA